ncbi:uncharacterized protein [Euphorbia lathyris]|uniref:uncharacterized protein isoform X2 n=1 Tax=Euphorbia lathyris TaxID=212925 RepID=UPI00331440CF
MKLSSTFAVARMPFLRPTFFRPVCSSSNSNSISCSSSPSPSFSCSLQVKPRTPLFLRPPIFSTPLSDIIKWHNWAKDLAASVGSSFAHLDNGPDSTLLCRELKWLLEDSLEDHSLISRLDVENNSLDVKLRTSVDQLYDLWRQRIQERRPFQYIVGCEHWRDLVLCVQEGVLIPRPETELIVDLVKDVILNNEGLAEGLWADLGTGSGAIALGIAGILGTQGRVVATDLSPVAVAVAAYNVHRYHQDKIEVRKGSWFEPVTDMEGKLAGVISNPPYIPADDISGLQAEVGKHEPRLALDGGTTGMDDLLHLINGAALMLKPGGFFAFETNGEKQCKFLKDHMEHNYPGSFCNVKIVSDFAGIERFVTGFHQ